MGEKDMPKSIAILHYSCPPVVGGVEEIVRQQASLFYRYHHHVKVLAGNGGPFSDEIDVEIHPLLSSRNSAILKLQKDPATNARELDDFRRQIYDYLVSSLKYYDILIAHNVLSMHYNLPLTQALHQLADTSGIKVIAWNHDSPFFYDTPPEHITDGHWSILRRYNTNIHYVTISASRVKEFYELYGENGTVVRLINNGIDPIRFFRLDRYTIRLIREQNLFVADLILVQPSRLHPRKNIELSIRVLHALQEMGINAKLLLTGAYDPHEDKTKNYYHKLLRLANRLGVNSHLIIAAEYTFKNGDKLSADRVIIRDLYLISDILFMPSLQEGFGIPLLEAGMIKLPIACSTIAPFKRIGDQNVFYFEPREAPQDIARRMIQFLESLPTHQMYRNVIRRYAWDNIYQFELLPFLESISE